MAKLSVIVNTKNAAKYLKAALASVEVIADEIVVVDMASADETVTIAQKFDNVKIYQYPDPEIGYADPAREFAFAKATGDWLLIVDADEELPKPLTKVIRQIVDGKRVATLPNLPPADVYYLPRHNEIFGKFIDKTGWYPDYQLRLWKKGMIEWRAGVHSQPKVKGKTVHLSSDNLGLAIIHHNYQTIEQFWSRAAKYSRAAAAEQAKTCAAKNLDPADLWTSFFDELWRRGFADQGLLEGNHGMALSLMQAAYQLIVATKIWEKQGFPERQLSIVELKNLRRQFMREAHYWWADLMVGQTTGLEQLYWRARRKLKI